MILNLYYTKIILMLIVDINFNCSFLVYFNSFAAVFGRPEFSSYLLLHFHSVHIKIIV